MIRIRTMIVKLLCNSFYKAESLKQTLQKTDRFVHQTQVLPIYIRSKRYCRKKSLQYTLYSRKNIFKTNFKTLN